jgi:protein NRD1
LGVLYVVDSISRMYQEQARRHGQDISTTLDDATFAGGLRHITSVLPSLMNDIIQHAPDTQKVMLKFYPNWELFRRNVHNFSCLSSCCPSSKWFPFFFLLPL